MSSSDLLVAGGLRVELCVCSSTVLLLLQWLSSELSDTLAAAAPSHSKHTHLSSNVDSKNQQLFTNAFSFQVLSVGTVCSGAAGAL